MRPFGIGGSSSHDGRSRQLLRGRRRESVAIGTRIERSRITQDEVCDGSRRLAVHQTNRGPSHETECLSRFLSAVDAVDAGNASSIDKGMA